MIDERAESLFCALNLLIIGVLIAVAKISMVLLLIKRFVHS